MVMRRKKNSKSRAFTLLEVILAIGVVVVAVSVITNIQLRSLFKVLRDRDEIEKTFFIKRELYTNFLRTANKKEKIVEKLENPEMTITTQFSKIGPKSTLAALKNKIKLVRSVGEWKNENVAQLASMVTFIVSLPADEKKEKSS